VRASLAVARRAVAVVLSCAGLAAGATACGTAQLSPSAAAARATQSEGPLAGLTADQITRRAIADLAAASSVHVAGSAGPNGQAAFLDMTLGTKECTETMRIPGQGTSTLLQIGTTVWFKPSDQMWKWMAYDIPAAARRHLEGKYLQTPDVPADLGPIAFCSPRQLASAFDGQLKDLVKGKITTILGQPALRLADKRHSTSAYVTISARPEFLRIDVSGQEHAIFTGYNRPLTLTPPPPGQTISTAQLAALGAHAQS
jgi:hypothetical protein